MSERREGRARAIKRTIVFSGLAIALATLPACSLITKKVSAFERGTLSKNGMQLVGAPQEQAGMNHMYNAREGSVGGFGGAGGGCGCN